MPCATLSPAARRASGSRTAAPPEAHAHRRDALAAAVGGGRPDSCGRSAARHSSLPPAEAIFHFRHPMFHSRRGSFHPGKAMFHPCQAMFHSAEAMFHPGQANLPRADPSFHSARAMLHPAGAIVRRRHPMTACVHEKTPRRQAGSLRHRPASPCRAWVAQFNPPPLPPASAQSP